MLSQWKLKQHICPAKQRTKICHLPVCFPADLFVCLLLIDCFFLLFCLFFVLFSWFVQTCFLQKGICVHAQCSPWAKIGNLESSRFTRLTLIRIPLGPYLSIVEELHHGSRRKNLQLRWITMGSYARKGEMAHLFDSAIPCMFSWKETPLISTARIEHTVVPLMIFSESQEVLLTGCKKRQGNIHFIF